MLNGLDLFSGIGGIALGLDEWIRPVAYCEIDRYAQAVLLSKMENGLLPAAPIWDDVKTLKISQKIDIITGGFPCQDLSYAGLGAGLAGERSGLFFEIARLTSELRPTFVFLENVPAISLRGGLEVIGTFTEMGYDCRWCTIGAASVGAPHKRERWFLLANANSSRCKKPTSKIENFSEKSKRSIAPVNKIGISTWNGSQPEVGRMAYGLPRRVDRIKCLGNAVVPLQVKTAFKILLGLK